MFNLTRFGWLIVCLLLCILPLIGWAEDPSPDILPPTAASVQGGPWWASVISTLVVLVLVPFAKQWLSNQAAAAAEQAKLHRIDASKSLVDQRGAILAQLEAYLLQRAAAIAEKEFPKLATLIIERQLTNPDQVKQLLRQWGRDLKGEALYFFNTQGIDLIATFGHPALDDLIEHVANRVSPFPGKDTAVALLKSGAASLLLDKGVEWMKGESLSTPLLAVGQTVADDAHG
jgi:hypothetical protein